MIVDFILACAYSFLQRLIDHHGIKDDIYTVATYKITESVLEWCQCIWERIGTLPSSDAKALAGQEAVRFYNFLHACISANEKTTGSWPFKRPQFSHKDMQTRIEVLRDFASAHLGDLIYQADALQKQDSANQIVELTNQTPLCIKNLRQLSGVMFEGKSTHLTGWSTAVPADQDYVENPMIIKSSYGSRRKSLIVLSRTNVYAEAYRSLTISLGSIHEEATKSNVEASSWIAPKSRPRADFSSSSVSFLDKFYLLQFQLHYLCQIVLLLCHNKDAIKFLPDNAIEQFNIYLSNLNNMLDGIIAEFNPMRIGYHCFNGAAQTNEMASFYDAIRDEKEKLILIRGLVRSLINSLDSNKTDRREEAEAVLREALTFITSAETSVLDLGVKMLYDPSVRAFMGVDNVVIVCLLFQANFAHTHHRMPVLAEIVGGLGIDRRTILELGVPNMSGDTFGGEDMLEEDGAGESGAYLPLAESPTQGHLADDGEEIDPFEPEIALQEALQREIEVYSDTQGEEEDKQANIELLNSLKNQLGNKRELARSLDVDNCETDYKQQ